MAFSYSDITKSAQTGTKAGYKPQLYFVKVSDVLTWQRPATTFTTPGDSVEIDTAHILNTGKATHHWDAKLYSAKVTSDPVGDPGALSLSHKATVVVAGDNSKTLEQILQMLNDDVVIFLKDADCINNNGYIQIGDDCNPVAVSPKFDSKDNSPTGGQKEWTFEITSAVRFFYLAALPAP